VHDRLLYFHPILRVIGSLKATLQHVEHRGSGSRWFESHSLQPESEAQTPSLPLHCSSGVHSMWFLLKAHYNPEFWLRSHPKHQRHVSCNSPRVCFWSNRGTIREQNAVEVDVFDSVKSDTSAALEEHNSEWETAYEF